MNPRITDWRGRRVWLVGASSGIGAALAAELAARGARLALSARHACALAALDLPEALRVPCDATEPGALARARERVLAALGGIDLAVYLAGDYRPMRAADFDLAEAERLLAVNYTGALRLAEAMLPGLAPGAGLVFVSSIAGLRGLPKALGYAPAKAALTRFAECLHLELAPRGIGVWVVHPGFVATRLTAANDFEMPALMRACDAAWALADGLGRGGFEIHFPRRFTGTMKLLALLPYRWYFPLVRRVTGG